MKTAVKLSVEPVVPSSPAVEPSNITATPTSEMVEKIRALLLMRAFEAWARTCDGNCAEYDLRKFRLDARQRAVDGVTYMNYTVERDWVVWQAAEKSMGLQSDEVVLKMFNELYPAGTVAPDEEGEGNPASIDAMRARVREILASFPVDSSKSSEGFRCIGYWFPEYEQAFVSETEQVGSEPIFARV